MLQNARFLSIGASQEITQEIFRKVFRKRSISTAFSHSYLFTSCWTIIIVPAKLNTYLPTRCSFDVRCQYEYSFMLYWCVVQIEIRHIMLVNVLFTGMHSK